MDYAATQHVTARAYEPPILGPPIRGPAYSLSDAHLFRSVTSRGRLRLARIFDSWSAMQAAVQQMRASVAA